MKKLILTSILTLLVIAGTKAIPQDYPDEYLGLPGDNLNLYAVMKLFQESETLEAFERSLNDENSKINNLDLNGDNLVDYITVHDYVDGDVHTIVLRVALNRNEFQDVAVFTVQKFRDGSVQIQLVGDEELYGSNYIIEPIYDETPNPGYMGKAPDRLTVTVVRTTPYEVAAWPIVRFIYLPNYVVWHSAWYWGYYPPYWHPWRPYYWHYYYGYHYHLYHHYYNHYRRWHHHRYIRYNDFYYSHVRTHSPYVSQRIKEGQYRSTYSHPEQRIEGEALFTKTNPNQTQRTAYNTPSIRERRPVPSNSSENRASGNTRRQNATDNERLVTRLSSDQNAMISRRVYSTVTERPVTRASSQQNTGTVRRSSATVTERPATRASSQQNSGTVRRSSATVTKRPAARSASSERAQVSRSPRQSSPVVRSSENRSSRERGQAQTSKRSQEKRESSGSSESRRK